MRVLICGGAGFVGLNLCDALQRRSDIERVTVLDDLSSGDGDAVESTGARLVVGSHVDSALIAALIDDCDAVVNLVDVAEGPWVGGDPVETERTIVGGMRNLVRAAVDHGGVHLVATSTSAVYGANLARPAHEELEVMPLTPQATAFAAAELHALNAGAVDGLDVLVLRVFDTFGRHRRPGHPSGRLVHDCLESALTGDDYVVAGDLHDRHEISSVDFVVRTIEHALQWRTTAPGPVNCATGRRLSANELVAAVAAVTGQRINTRRAAASAIPRHIASTRRFIATIGPMDLAPLSHEIAATWAWAHSSQPVVSLTESARY